MEKRQAPSKVPARNKKGKNGQQAEKSSYYNRNHIKEILKDEDYAATQLERILFALDALKEGDISVRLAKEGNDIFSDIAEAYNSMVEMISGVGTEVSRISTEAGKDGKLSSRASSEYASGFWQDIINNINGLIEAIDVPVN